MAQAKNIRLYTPAGEKIDDLALAEDYLAADKAGPFRVGRRALYYRDGGLKRYCIPFDQIDHAFTRVVACATHVCCARGGVHGDGELCGRRSGAAESAHPRPEARLHGSGQVNAEKRRPSPGKVPGGGRFCAHLMSSRASASSAKSQMMRSSIAMRAAARSPRRSSARFSRRLRRRSMVRWLRPRAL